MSCEDGTGPDCEEALGKLYVVIDQECGEADLETIQEHLEECAPCLSEYDAERIIKKIVARSCSESAPEPLRDRILTTIRSVEVTVTYRD